MFNEYVHEYFKDSSARIHYTCAVAYNCHWENHNLFADDTFDCNSRSELNNLDEWCSYFWINRSLIIAKEEELHENKVKKAKNDDDGIGR